MTSNVSFEIIDLKNLTLKVLGCFDLKNLEYKDPPACLVKNQTARLVEGKFPLNDYRDTSNHSQHKYVIELDDGTTISGILDGFTYDCTYDGQGKDLGLPEFDIMLEPSQSSE